MFYTYILYSISSDKYYIGSTENPEERLKKHQNKNKGFTNQADDWEFVYQKSFETKNEAILHENQIKKWKSRKMIIKLIHDNSR